jgi:diguanylate cyclase (GGDEF)-like protein/PAS domain S-box-containing protein
MFALLFPAAINLLYRFGAGGIRGVDWTSITFSISSLLIIYALYCMRFLDIAPIARDKLINNLSDAMIVLDLQNRIVDINPEAANVLGIPPAFLIGRDLTEALPIAGSFLGQPPEREVKDEFFVDLAHKKRYFDALLSPVRDERQKLVGRLIIARDITERKENEIRLLQLTQAVEQSPASVVITDLDGNITYANPQFSELTGYSLREVIGRNPNITQSGRTPIETYEELWQTIKSGRTWRGELLNRKKNGELYWEYEVIAPVFDPAGQMISFIAVKDDITARKEAEARLLEANRQLEERLKDIEGLQVILREQAIRDSLTGLHNRHYLKEALKREIARAEREEYPICFILMDLDGFKKINDTYGHAAGDITIQYFANLLKKQTRAGDIICRYGGEEFLLVLPNTDISSAAEIAERLRRDFENSEVSGIQIKATTSCGISEFPSHGATEEKVLAAADIALYAAKERGRNRVVIWTEISAR